MIIGIDPGIDGALVAIHKNSQDCPPRWHKMPFNDGTKELEYDLLIDLLKDLRAGYPACVFLERAVSFAMGSKGAFNYGRAFAKIEIALKSLGIPVTYVEPSKWTKVIFEGIDKNLKAKAQAAIAVERLFPTIFDTIPRTPKSKKLDEGVVDALLIAEYGRRKVHTS